MSAIAAIQGRGGRGVSHWRRTRCRVTAVWLAWLHSTFGSGALRQVHLFRGLPVRLDQGKGLWRGRLEECPEMDREGAVKALKRKQAVHFGACYQASTLASMTPRSMVTRCGFGASAPRKIVACWHQGHVVEGDSLVPGEDGGVSSAHRHTGLPFWMP